MRPSSYLLLQLYSAPAIMGTLTYMPLREDSFVHLHYCIPGETKLCNVFQREEEN